MFQQSGGGGSSSLVNSEIAQLIFELVTESTDDDLNAFSTAVRSGSINQQSSIVDFEYLLRGSRESIQKFRTCLTLWATTNPGGVRGLADAIDSCVLAAARSRWMPRSELVWTGPASGHPTARRTLQVLNEMLQHATESVLIVGYSLFLRGELAKGFIHKLAGLSAAGIEIRFIVDWRYRGWGPNGEAGHSVREIFNAWPPNARAPKVYSWQNAEDESAKLHAKLMLVDNRDLIVTSANLSGGGMETNLELGLRVQGEAARSCGDHFKSLIQTGYFREEDWKPEDI